MSADDYVPLDQYRIAFTGRAYAVFGVAAGLGGLMLLSRFTVGFGLLVLAITMLFWHLPRLSRGHARERFAKYRHLHGPVTYGISSRGVWLRGPHFSAEAGWKGVATWREDGSWLVLSCWGVPPVYLPIDALKQNGIFDDARRVARLNGVEEKT